MEVGLVLQLRCNQGSLIRLSRSGTHRMSKLLLQVCGFECQPVPVILDVLASKLCNYTTWMDRIMTCLAAAADYAA